MVSKDCSLQVYLNYLGTGLFRLPRKYVKRRQLKGETTAEVPMINKA